MTKQRRLRKAHGEFCKAMADWNKDFSEAWTDEKRHQAAERNGIDPQEFKKWQQG